MTKAEERALEAYPDSTRDKLGILTFLGYSQLYRDCFIGGYEQAEKDLGLHSVEESLPPMDEEVIVLTNVINGRVVNSARYICFGHIVNKEYAVDYDGWNIPGVKYWMPCPKLPED